MKYYVSASPGPMPTTPEMFDAASNWLEAKLVEAQAAMAGQ